MTPKFFSQGLINRLSLLKDCCVLMLKITKHTEKQRPVRSLFTAIRSSDMRKEVAYFYAQYLKKLYGICGNLNLKRKDIWLNLLYP